jgi:serine/threonine-protein kinase
MIGTIGEGVRLGGRYILQERVGSGGAATVWLADDTVLERPIAVKVLSEALASDENWLARFEREAQIAAGLSHPNLVSVYDFDAGDERPYIVMAYMSGGSLWDRMQAGEGSDPERLAGDILSALEAIHSAGIVHRDVKPGNVLFSARGTACLTDFGVARPEDATSLTQTGQIPGTAKFMAPELWAGEPADERSDLFAAGVVLRGAIGNDAPPVLLELMDRLSAEDRGERPASAGEALDELRLDGSPPVAPVLPPLPEGPTPRKIVIQSENRSHRGAAIAGVALLALVAAFGIAQALGGGDDPGQAGSSSSAEKAASSEKNEKQPDSGGGSDSASDEQATGEATPVAARVDPIALDQEGKALIDAGRPEEAIPILQQAVDYYDKDSRDINYAYSLYNLGDALLLAGRPDEAIPYLEKRLTWDDQTETVQQTLDEAYAAAGEGSEPEKEPKAKPSGKVPPGQAKKDD